MITETDHGKPIGHTQDYTVDRAARSHLKGQTARVMWLTGLPGAGKSTLADALDRHLHAQGRHTYVLDGDNVRGGLTRDLGFSHQDRTENVRRVAEAAKLLFDAGLVVIVALVSPYRADRDAARALFDDGDFLEVWVDTPLEVCAERDPKGLYARARAGSLRQMTGVGQEYQEPEHPHLVVTGTGSVPDVVTRLAAAVAPTP
jgi:bifunctional enzyme CysN/CysC